VVVTQLLHAADFLVRILVNSSCQGGLDDRLAEALDGNVGGLFHRRGLERFRVIIMKPRQAHAVHHVAPAVGMVVQVLLAHAGNYHVGLRWIVAADDLHLLGFDGRYILGRCKMDDGVSNAGMDDRCEGFWYWILDV